MNYITVAYADGYILNHPQAGPLWTALDDTAKEKMINWVEQEFDNLSLLGEKVDPQQPNEFPRYLTSWAMKYDKWAFVDNDVRQRIKTDDANIPNRLLQALCEMIIAYLNTKQFQKFVEMQDVGVSEFEAGSVSFIFDKPRWNKPLPPKAWQLAAYLTKWYWAKANPTFLERV